MRSYMHVHAGVRVHATTCVCTHRRACACNGACACAFPFVQRCGSSRRSWPTLHTSHFTLHSASHFTPLRTVHRAPHVHRCGSSRRSGRRRASHFALHTSYVILHIHRCGNSRRSWPTSSVSCCSWAAPRGTGYRAQAGSSPHPPARGTGYRARPPTGARPRTCTLYRHCSPPPPCCRCVVVLVVQHMCSTYARGAHACTSLCMHMRLHTCEHARLHTCAHTPMVTINALQACMSTLKAHVSICDYPHRCSRRLTKLTKSGKLVRAARPDRHPLAPSHHQGVKLHTFTRSHHLPTPFTRHTATSGKLLTFLSPFTPPHHHTSTRRTSSRHLQASFTPV